LPWQQSEADFALLLSDVVDPAHGMTRPLIRKPASPWCAPLYQLASRDGQDGARDQIAYIVSPVCHFQQLQRPFLRAFEEVAKIAGKLAASEQEAAARGLPSANAMQSSRPPSAERATRKRVLRRRLRRSKRSAGQIAGLAGEREARAEFEREANGLRATLAEREAAFAELSRWADELLAAQQAAQSRAGGARGGSSDC